MTHTDTHPTPGDLLDEVARVRARQLQDDARLLALACEWADAHPDLHQRPAVPALGPDWFPDDNQPILGDDPADEDLLIPGIAWDAPAAFAAALGMSTQGGEGLIRDALVLRHRLPQVWARVQALEVPAWRARRIASAVFSRPADVSEYLDEHVAPVAEKVGTTTLDRLIDEAMLRLHAEERELAQLEALDATHVTLHEESINETGIGDMSIRADWAGLHDFDATVTDVANVIEPLHAQEPFEARRARAIGILADPAYAAALLAGDTDQPDQPDQPDRPDQTDQPDQPAPTKPTTASRQSRRGVHLFVHVTQATLDGALGGEVARVETKTGGAGRPTLAQQVATWCGRPESEVKVTQVIDLNAPVSVDRYEVGARMATRVALREPTCVFPWCARPARHCDKDHCTPHAEGGETCDHNLAPLCRRHHRLKTHTAWHYERLPLDIGWRWTDPHGMTYLRDHHGTRASSVKARPRAA